MKTKRSKYIPAGLTVLYVLLICIASLKDDIMEPLRTGAGYFLIPIQTGVDAVDTGIYDELEDYGSLKNALRENRGLEAQIVQFIEGNNHLQAEQFELDHLRRLYELDQNYVRHDRIEARVIARNSEKWSQVFRINKGSADGMTVDMNVVADGGLMGIVTDMGVNYTAVRSVMDDSNRVGAIDLNSSYNCIVVGDLTLYEEGRLKLTDFSRDAILRDGNQIVTSNISTKFFPRALVEYAADISVDPDHLTRSGYLVPMADFNSLQEILIITDIKDTGEAAVQ